MPDNKPTLSDKELLDYVRLSKDNLAKGNLKVSKNYESNLQETAPQAEGFGSSKYDTSDISISALKEGQMAEIRAQKQGVFDKWANGVTKAAGIAGTSILENTAGLVYGIGAAVGEQDISKLYNNGFTQSLDEFNNYVAKAMPNYHTKAEQDYNLLQKMGTANFWSESALSGAAYMGAAIATGAGLSKFASLGKLARAGVIIDEARLAELGGVKSVQGAKYLDDLARPIKIADAIDFDKNAILMSHGESAQEARQTYNDTKQQLIQDYKSQYGEPTEQAMQAIEANAKAAGNWGYATNLAITGTTNALLFPKLLSEGYGMNKVKLNNIELQGGKYVAEQESVRHGMMKELLKGSLEEGGQELGQLATQKTLTDYYSQGFKDKKDQHGMVESLVNGLSQTLGTEEGLENFFLGAIMGGPMGAYHARGETMQQNAATSKVADLMNNPAIQKTVNSFSNFVRATNYEKEKNTALVNGSKFDYLNAEYNQNKSIAKQFIDNNATDHLISQYEDMKSMPEEEFKKVAGYDADKPLPKSQGEIISDAVNLVKSLDKTNESVKLLFPYNEAKHGSPENYNVLTTNLWHYSTSIDNMNKRESEIKNEIFKIASDKKVKIEGDGETVPFSIVDNPMVAQQVNQMNSDLNLVKAYRAKLIESYHLLADEKTQDAVLNDIKKTADEKSTKPAMDEKTYQDHLNSKNELLDKISNSEDHNEIQNAADELAKNPLLTKEDIDKTTEKYNSIKEKSIRRSQINSQLETAKAHRDNVLGVLFTLNRDIEERASSVNSIVKDFEDKKKNKEYVPQKSDISEKELFKLVDETQSDIFKLRDRLDVGEKMLAEADAEIERLITELQANEGIESVRTELGHKLEEKQYIDKQILSIKNKITTLDKILKKLKQIFKALFPNSKALLEKGKVEVVEAKEEIMSQDKALKELKSTLKEFNDIRDEIIKDIDTLNKEIADFESQLSSANLSFEISEPIIDDNAIEVTNEPSSKKEFDKARKDITYVLTSTAGNNMKGDTDKLTDNEDQLRWFEHTSMMQVGSKLDNKLMAITKANNPFGDQVKFYDDNTILLVLHTDGKAVLVNGKLVYTSMRLPMSLSAAKEQFTNKQNLSDAEINVLIDGLDVLRSKIKSSKEPLFLKVTGKTKGIQVESNVKNINGKVIYKFPVYGRLTKNTKKLDDLHLFVGTGESVQVGSQLIDTTAGMVYTAYDGQIIPLKVAKLGEINGATDKAIELIKKLMEINSPNYKGKEIYKDVYDKLNLLILFGNVNESPFKIFVTKDGRLNYDGKFHDKLNEADLKRFLDNKYIRVDKKLLDSNKKVTNPITGEKSSYKYYLLNNKGKADDQVLVGTSIANQDRQQFLNVGLKFDVLGTPAAKTETVVQKVTPPVKLSGKSKEEIEVEKALDAAMNASELVVNEDPLVSSLLNPKVETEKTEVVKAQENAEPLNKDDDEAFAAALQKASDDTGIDFDRTFLPEEQPATQAELANEETWFRTNFPQIDYTRLKGLIGDKAVGRLTSQGKVLISDLAAKGTTYHEAWHVVSQLLLSKSELDALYKDYRDRTGSKATDREIEELIAEDFRNYMLGERMSFSPKTKSIFQKIIDWFKSFFKLNNNDLDSVFANIKNGKFKSSDIIRNAKEDFNRTLPGKSVEFTKDLIDSVNVFFFKNLLSIDDSNSIENLFDKGKNVSDIYDKVLDNFLATYKSYPEELKERLKDNYTYLHKNWKLVVDEHIKSLEKYGVKIAVKDSEEVEIPSTEEGQNYETKVDEFERTTKDNTYIDSITFSSKDGMPKSIKLLVASLPQGRIVDGKFKVDINTTFGTPKASNYNTTLNFLFNKLAGSQSLKDMVAKLSNNSAIKPELVILMKYLKSNPSSVTPVTLSPSQFRLQMQFFQQFAKTNNKYLTTMLDEDGNIYSFDSNSSKLGEKIKTLWKNNMKSSINSGNGFYYLTKDGLISIDKNRVNSIANQYPLSNINNTLMFLSKFGIDFSTKKFTEEEENLLKKAASKILDYAVNKDVADIFQKNVIGESMSDMLNIEANYNTSETELQHINPEGKTVYGITLNSYLSLMVNDINNTYSISHFDEEKNTYAKGSLWAKMINEGKKLRLVVAEGMKSNQPGKEGVLTSKLDMSSYLVQSIGNILNNRFPFLRAGDKTLEYMFEIPFDMNKEEFVDQMLSYYKDDAMRSLELKKGAGKNIQYYEKQANKSLLFEDITSLYPNFSKITTEKGIDKFIKDNKEELSKAIEEYLQKQADEFKSTVLAYKIVNSNKEGTEFSVKGIDKTALSNILGKTETINANELNRLAETFTIKSLVANIEQTKLFTGDLAFYNVATGDFNKRTGGLTGPKKVTNIDPETNEWLNENRKRQDGKFADGKVKTVIYKDVESTSEYLDLYRELIGKEKADEAYKDMKEADAQGYITLDEYREFLERSGEWTPEHEKAYQSLIKGEKLTKDNFQYFMPLKPQYFGPQTNENGMYVPTYYKFSLMPLIPSMIKGRQIENLNEYMKKNQVGIAMFASANKVGANLQDGKLVDFYNNKGEINENTNIQEINYKYLGIQLDIAPIEKRKVTFGTQVRKLVLSNLFSNGKSKDISILRDGKIEKVTGESIKNDYDSTINKLTSIKRAKLKERLKLSPREDGTYGISDIEEFKNIILSEAESRDVADNILKSIEYALDGDNKFIDATVSKNKIEQILYSLVNNNVISQKMFGDMKVMGSSAGFELEARKFKTLTEKDKSNIQWIGNTQTLQFYHKLEDGSTSKMQVLLPHWFKEIHGDLKQLDSRLLELIGYRIPTDGLGAIDSIEVVGFLPKECGNLIITPSEIVGKAGSDYDVDKLNVFIPNYIMVSGKPQYLPTNLKDQQQLYSFIKESDPKYKKSFNEFLSDHEEQILQNNVLKITRELLSSPEMLAQLITPTSTITLKQTVTELRQIIDKNVKKITGTSLMQWFNNAQTAISFWSGKAGVGIAALHNTSHILAQQAGLYVSPEAKTIMNLTHNLTENGDIDLSSEFDATGKQRISDIIKEFLNAYVDIARDPFVFDLNAGIQTANTWLYLVRAGVPVKTVGQFMRQPIIWDYIKAQSINESLLNDTVNEGDNKVLSKVQLIKQIRDEYGREDFKSDEEFSFKEKDLVKYLPKGVIRDAEFNKAQQAILTEFLEHQRVGRILGEMMQATDVDTKGSGKNRNAARNKIEALEKVIEQGMFGNFDKYINDSILKEFITTVKESRNYYDELFITDKKDIREGILDKLKDNFKSRDISADKLDRLMDSAENELITFIIHTQGQDKLTDKIDELFTGDNSLAFRLLAAKKDPKLSKNLFIQNSFPLVANNRKNIDNVKQFSKKMSVYESNQLTEAYSELYNLAPGLADDLTKLAILQSGIANSPISFTSIIPADKFFEIASKAINIAAISENSNLGDFIDLFYQNNYSNNDLVRKLPNWKLNKDAHINGDKLTFEKNDNFYSNDFYLKVITVDNSISKKEREEMQARGENIFETRLYKKTGDLEFTEVPTKGNGMYLKDYRKTDNIVERKPALNTNEGTGSAGMTFSSNMSVEDALALAFGAPVLKETKKTANVAQPQATVSSDKVVEGDIFALPGIPVITTNLGGVHGAGLAQAAKAKGLIKQGEGDFKATSKVVSLPVKKVWSDNMSMNDNMELLKNSLRSLIKVAKANTDKTFLLPLAGLGHGEGSIQDILPLLINTVQASPNIKLVIPAENVSLGRQGSVRKDYTRENMPTIKVMLTQAGLLGTQSSTNVDYNYNPSNVSEKTREDYKQYVLKELGNPEIKTKVNAFDFIYPDLTITIFKDGSVNYTNVNQKIVDLSKKDSGYDIKFMIGLNKLAEEFVQTVQSSTNVKESANKLQNTEKKTILTNEQLDTINLSVAMAGYKDMYSMERFNALSEENKQKLIKCYL